jgi:hypothetical protein
MECSICLEQSECLLVSLECKHTFHASCIAKWLLRSRTCPICRNPETFERSYVETFENITRSNTEHQLRSERSERFVDLDSTYTTLLRLIALVSILSIVFKPFLHSMLLSLAIFFKNYRLLVLLLPGKWFLVSIVILCALEIKQQLFTV